jgi:hypothetical protein
MDTHVVQGDDLEDFALRLGEAVSQCSLDGPPVVAFSHAPTEGGFNYAAVVVGTTSPGAQVETRRIGGDEG